MHVHLHHQHPHFLGRQGVRAAEQKSQLATAFGCKIWVIYVVQRTGHDSGDYSLRTPYMACRSVKRTVHVCVRAGLWHNTQRAGSERLAGCYLAPGK